MFPESALAHKYLDGLTGIEIGGANHNPFGLSTINVDITDDPNEEYKQVEREMLKGTNVAPIKVDVVAPGDNLPFMDKSYDFVISSHAIEHFWDPLAALYEWKRVARKYIFIIAPHVDRTPDRGRPLTTIEELEKRHSGEIVMPEHRFPLGHWSVWNTEAFLELCKHLGFNVIDFLDKDDKAENGFAVVISLEG